MSLYSDQLNAIKDILSNAPELSKVKKVYKGDFEAIPLYPAIAINLKGRRKTGRGIGGLKDTECSFEIWVYTNKPSYESAIVELEDLTDQIETVLKKDRQLSGTCDMSNLNIDAEFGVADRGGVFLQTALLQLNTRKLGV
jgi:hypothetical protein